MTSAGSLSAEQLIDELAYLYSTRHRTLRFASDAELAAHTRRMSELEQEYCNRLPHREVDVAPGGDDFAEEQTPSGTDPAASERSWAGTDERADRPTRA